MARFEDSLQFVDIDDKTNVEGQALDWRDA